MNTATAPSEAVVASALRHCLWDFLLSLPLTHFLKKFLVDKWNPETSANLKNLHRDNRL
jgi:hypothetical protein